MIKFEGDVFLFYVDRHQLDFSTADDNRTVLRSLGFVVDGVDPNVIDLADAADLRFRDETNSSCLGGKIMRKVLETK